MSRELAKRWITSDEYERMGEAGVFPPDARLELIEGEIYAMSPIGSPHAACVKFLSELLSRLFGGKLIVSVQDPIRLNDFSEPQPDLALLRWRDDFYRGAHPTPADVLLVVEVADTTVVTDRSVKIPLYARAGIQEVWLVNIPDELIEIYADPAGDAYRIAVHTVRGERAQSLTLKELAVSVGDLLG
ncbi:MAG TPA: Uma2 family endonuclease [Pyrinomonadaceae bacterium]|nr:Uma2 family endonuclease [Pyrinomonadaceae bacterium]